MSEEARRWREAAMVLRRHADDWDHSAEQLEAAEQIAPTVLPVEREMLIGLDSVLSLIVARYGGLIPDDVRDDANRLVGELRNLTQEQLQ